MRKNRSPVTGLRKLAKDSHEALAIRQRLAKELQDLSANLSDDGSPLHIRSGRHLAYLQSGNPATVTPAQIETYGLELVNKDILKDVAPHPDGGLLFYPAKQGLITIRRGNRSMTEAPKAIFTNEIKTRQTPSMKDKASATTIRKSTTLLQKDRDGKPRIAQPVIKIDVFRAIQDIRSIDPSKLITIWENARRMLANEQKRTQHEEIAGAITAIELEWERRNNSGVADDYFDWPTTEAHKGNGSLSLDDIRKNGVLSQLDYHVGRTNGHPDTVRKHILTKAFEKPLPDTATAQEFDEWGSARTAKRLRKIAYSIAAFTRNAKRRNPVLLEVAINQWEADLDFLYGRYYVGKFNFAWPSTALNRD